MPRPFWRLVSFAVAFGCLLVGCTLVDLSGLQKGGGGATSSSVASSSSSSDASTVSAGGSSPCGASSCSVHGECVDNMGTASCACDVHFDGMRCDVCANGYVGGDCLGCATGFQDADYDGTCLPACNPTTCSGNGTCSDATGMTACTCTAGFSGNDCSSTCPAGTGGPSCNYQIVYGLNIPTVSNFDAYSDIPYDIDQSATIGSFTRVAYRLVLDSQEVWVDMDAFTTDATKLGVPVTWVWQLDVANATVTAISPNQSSIPVPTTGGLEFWSDCYDQGNDGEYDEHDVREGMKGCYGSMQVAVGGSTVLAYNSWTNNGTIDVGIGRAKTGHPDWTFASNANDFTKRRLEVYVLP